MARNILFGNFTFGSNDSAATKLHNSKFCPSYVFETLDSSIPYIVNAVLSMLLAITTTFANLLVLLAMRHVTSIRLPSRLLLCSLLLSDLGSGLILQTQTAALLFMKTSKSPSAMILCLLFKSIEFFAWLFGGVSVLTMTAISLDRYTALFYHIRYQQIVTTRQVSVVLIFVWLFSVFIASTGLWDLVVRGHIAVISFVVCFLVISVAYIKIYQGLRKQHGQVQTEISAQAQQGAGNTLSMARYKRIASAMLRVYVLFILCFVVPFVYVQLKDVTVKNIALAQWIWEFLSTVAFLSSCLNPFVYCARLPDIRTEVLKKTSQLCFLCRSVVRLGDQETPQETD